MAAPAKDVPPLIIVLNQIMKDYDGQLSLARKAHHTDDVLIHWSVEMDVADKGERPTAPRPFALLATAEVFALDTNRELHCPENYTRLRARQPTDRPFA